MMKLEDMSELRSDAISVQVRVLLEALNLTKKKL